jgi:hypothetical protein
MLNKVYLVESVTELKQHTDSGANHDMQVMRIDAAKSQNQQAA